MALPRGVIIQGKVLEEGSDAPVVGASVQYHAEEANNPNHKDQIVTGWQDIHLADNDGRFKIVVLPGPGRLLVHGPGDSFVLQETSESELYKGKPGGRQLRPRYRKDQPGAELRPPEIVIRIKHGADDSRRIGRSTGKRHRPGRGLLPAAYRSSVTLVERVRRRSERRAIRTRGPCARSRVSRALPGQQAALGATLVAKAGMESPRVVLKPCGSAKMRFVDDKGKPVAKYEPFVQLVVTPGAQEYSEAMMKGNALAADAASVESIDSANNPFPHQSDADGRYTVAALIPGATYRIATYRKQRFELAKEFKAIANETIDLGDITVERKE